MRMCHGNGSSVAPSSSDESNELLWFPGMVCAAGGGGLPCSRGSRTVDDAFQSSFDESEELSLLWRIWCSTRGGGSDPALEELDSDTLRIANLELQKTWRDISDCSPSDSELEDTYVCSCLDRSGGISASVLELFESPSVE